MSKTSLPEHHFLDSNFDIVISENKIKILCARSDWEYINNKINEGQTYLSGIETFIEVHSAD